jgi:hypothetical protein
MRLLQTPILRNSAVFSVGISDLAVVKILSIDHFYHLSVELGDTGFHHAVLGGALVLNT